MGPSPVPKISLTDDSAGSFMSGSSHRENFLFEKAPSFESAQPWPFQLFEEWTAEGDSSISPLLCNAPIAIKTNIYKYKYKHIFKSLGV